jgi:hypothetical protein
MPNLIELIKQLGELEVFLNINLVIATNFKPKRAT